MDQKQYIKKYRPISNLLTQAHGPLKQMQDHVARLQEVSARIRELLPPPLNLHCGVANLKPDSIVLYADSPAWYTQLRFQGPALLTQLKKVNGLEKLQDLRIKILSDHTC